LNVVNSSNLRFALRAGSGVIGAVGALTAAFSGGLLMFEQRPTVVSAHLLGANLALLIGGVLLVALSVGFPRAKRVLPTSTLSRDHPHTTTVRTSARPHSGRGMAIRTAPDRRDRWGSWAAIVVVLVVAAAALAASAGLHRFAIYQAEQERTVVTEARVANTREVNDGTSVGIVLESDARAVVHRVWHDGASVEEVEDTVRVAYDPHDLANIALANLPPVPRALPWILVTIAVSLCFLAAGGGAALAVWLRTGPPG
jgi:hypothetical protein